MMKKKFILMIMAVLLISTVIANGSKDLSSEKNVFDGAVEGDLIVLTHRTDLIDSKFQEYKDAFEELYPDVNVEFEGITDYDGTVRTRMSTKEYGDVLCLPTGLKSAEYADYFEPLGSVEEFSKKYNFTGTSNAIDYDGVVYCWPTNANVSGGIVYNKKVFQKAGVEVPRTKEEFIEVLKMIKENTDAVPLFLNYPSKWTLNQWEGGLTSACGDIDYKNKIIYDDAPFVVGDGHYEIYKLMYDVVRYGFCEEDILTSDWERSKQMCADGEIGCMVLGSWAISQIKSVASSPEDIGYMPFPFEIDGKKCVEATLDKTLCINKYSKNKASAYAWCKFFAEETDFVTYNQSIPVLKNGGQYPAVLDSFKDLGVEYIQMNAPSEAEIGVYDSLDKESEIGFWVDPEKVRIVDAAMGTTNETFEDIMNDWNKRWAKARLDLDVKK